MKIVAGLGTIDEYIRLVKAGADEVFCGYVPYEWNKRYGSLFPLNRREVLYYKAQIGTLEDMKILKKMVDIYKVPVTIAINYLFYLEEQYTYIGDIIKELISIGFNEFIIADISLILYLREKGISCNIHLSGECCEINSLSIEFLNKLGISRYIFHRKNTIDDMKSCIENNSVKNLQYEAFILNERCHYTGAFCSSLHCDELCHLCMMPYEITKIDENCNDFKNIDEKIEKYYNESEYNYEENEEYIVGKTGCGLCALKKLKDAGITHLKVVGRGNFIENMEKDIRVLKESLLLLDNIKTNTYEEEVKKIFFNNKCSNECYYLD